MHPIYRFNSMNQTRYYPNNVMLLFFFFSLSGKDLTVKLTVTNGSEIF